MNYCLSKLTLWLGHVCYLVYRQLFPALRHHMFDSQGILDWHMITALLSATSSIFKRPQDAACFNGPKFLVNRTMTPLVAKEGVIRPDLARGRRR